MYVMDFQVTGSHAIFENVTLPGFVVIDPDGMQCATTPLLRDNARSVRTRPHFWRDLATLLGVIDGANLDRADFSGQATGSALSLTK